MGNVLPLLVLIAFGVILVAICVALVGFDDDRPYPDEDAGDDESGTGRSE